MRRICLRLLLLASIAGLQAPLFGNDVRSLAGVWFVESSSPEGMIGQTLELIQAARGMTGKWSSMSNLTWRYSGTVKEIHVGQANISFRVSNDSGPGILWKGHLQDNDHFTMSLINDDGVPVRTRLFRRASVAELVAARANMPRGLVDHKTPLPPLQELPFNGLALTPPMGWNSWNSFKETINDQAVRETANALVSSGLRDAGYVYVTIDDGWQGSRDDNGLLHSNAKFPDMKALAAYLHDRGLKFGIYSSPGPETCAGYVGSHGYERQDAHTFAEWGVDFVKFDWCSAVDIYKSAAEMRAVFQRMGAALRAENRPMVYSLSQYGEFSVGTWARKAGGNLWRTGDDSGPQWASVDSRFDSDGNGNDSGPGGWNDPDLLVIGLGAMTTEEYRTNMTLWAMLAAPLFLGNDVRVMTPDVKDILLNKEVIAVDQDRLGRQGIRRRRLGRVEIWTRQLADGATAVALFNRADASASVRVPWSELGFAGVKKVRDLWRKADVKGGADGYVAEVPQHGALLLSVSTVH